MTVSQKQSKRSSTGARNTFYRKRRQHDDGRESAKPTVGNTAKRMIRTLGGSIKERALYFDSANVFFPNEKKHKIVKIKAVVENPANINFVRRNIITKGAIIDTEAGKAKVTSRPGQQGAVNAVFLD
jgi:small subunit ribosomal protein S8e